MLANGNKEILCLALTQCNCDYSVSSWYPAMFQTAKRKLQVVQNKLIRFILNLGPRNHVGIEQLNIFGLLKVDDRAKQLRLHNAHKVFYKLAPEYLMANFNKSRNGPGMNTRHRACNFELPRVTREESCRHILI